MQATIQCAYITQGNCFTYATTQSVMYFPGHVK